MHGEYFHPLYFHPPYILLKPLILNQCANVNYLMPLPKKKKSEKNVLDYVSMPTTYSKKQIMEMFIDKMTEGT